MDFFRFHPALFSTVTRGGVAVAAALLSAAFFAPAAQAQLINGSFETGNFTGVNQAGSADTTQLFNGDTNITGWTAIDELSWSGAANPFGLAASNGNRFLDLTGFSDNQPEGGVQQVLNLTVGNTYRVNFDLGYSQRYPTVPDGITVTATGAAAQTFNYSGVTNTDVSWQNFAYSFTATSASTTLSLRGSTTSAGSFIGLDNVTLTTTGVSAAPEPGTLALLGMAALPFAGLVLRRRKA